MERIQVNSTSVKSIGYDPATRTLEVELVAGGVYQYFNVAPQVHRDLLAAPSIGRYFAHFVKTTFRSRKLT